MSILQSVESFLVSKEKRNKKYFIFTLISVIVFGIWMAIFFSNRTGIVQSGNEFIVKFQDGHSKAGKYIMQIITFFASAGNILFYYFPLISE